MIKRYFYYFNILILTLILILTSTACNKNSDDSNKLLQSQSQQSECQVIQHEFGKSCIPFNPQRIIVTDDVSLEILIALNIKPIAAPEPSFVASKANFLGKKMQSVQLLGKENTLNLEKIAQLKPDLIIGLYNITPENYKLFSRIAPTVNIKYIHRDWKQTLITFSTILGKQKQAEQQLINYQRRIEKIQAALGHRLNKIETSITRLHGSKSIEFRSRYSFPGSILDEIGFTEPKSQQELVKNPEDTLIIISPEKFDLLDADYLFVAVDPAAQDLFQRYQNNPLWQKLDVVKNQRVYTVNSGYWIFGNILSANAILDDINQYIVKDKLLISDNKNE